MTSDLDQLKAALSDHAAEIAEQLFGKPTKRTARELRFGKKGSISIRLGGRNGARFHSFEAAKGGSMLDAIMFAHSCDLARAVEIARELLSGGVPSVPRPQRKPVVDVDAEQERAIAEARALWSAARPIEGRPAARYLASRGLGDAAWTTDLVRHAGKATVSEHLRWRWWQGGAAVFPIRDAAGDITAVQLVAIDDAGAPIRDHEGKKLKRTRGRMTGATLKLPGDETEPLLLAEGPETSASCWMATGWTTWSMTGGVARADLSSVPVEREIIICADDDPARSPAGKALRDAIRRWRRESRTVLMAKPWPLTRRDKSDFNDLLQQDGVEAVRERIKAARMPDGRTHGCKLDVATPELIETLKRELRALAAWVPTDSLAGIDAPAPFLVGRTTTGAGKTEIILRELLALARKGTCSVFLGPTHEQIAEAQTRLFAMAKAAGVDVSTAIWRGRDRDNPDRPGETMCVEHELAAAILDARGDPEDLCRICPHRETCEQSGYRAQQARKATIWFAPSAILWAARPKAMKAASVAVIDEAFALGGIRDADRSARISLRDLELAPSYRARERRFTETGADGKKRRRRVPISEGKRTEIENDIATELMPIRRRLLAALAEHGDGDLRLDALVAAGMTAELADDARKLVEGLLVRIEITATTTRDGIADQIAGAHGNGAVMREALLWRLIAEQLCAGIAVGGRVRLYDRKTRDAGTVRVIEMATPAMIAEEWRAIPTLHLDATADMEIIRQRVPHAELVADIGIDAPHTRVVQYVGPAFGKAALTDGSGRLRDAWLWSLAQARLRGGRALVITHKDAVKRIRESFTVPEWMELASFGSVAGLDGFGDVRTLIVLGRWGLGPDDAGRTAGILSGHGVPRLGADWYPSRLVTLRGADGTVATVEADHHPHRLAEAVRRATVLAELLQAIGRGRGIRRDADNPLDVLICGNTPTGLPLASVRPWQRLSADEAAFAMLGVWAESHSTMGAMAGIPAATIKKARDRAATTGTGRREDISSRACPSRQAGALAEELGGLFAGWEAEGGVWPADLGIVRMKRAGRQHETEILVFDRREPRMLRDRLEDHFGELALFELVDPTLPPAPVVKPAPAVPKAAPRHPSHPVVAASAPVPARGCALVAAASTFVAAPDLTSEKRRRSPGDGPRRPGGPLQAVSGSRWASLRRAAGFPPCPG
jgi:putative DNA primase/helicase